jgi:sugar O-acyltransferase (sialic acid O-acetyltransferase NeuD family)
VPRAVRPLLLVGAGGFARETAEAVRAVNAVQPTWDLLGYLDEDPARHGELVGGLPVLGPLALVADHADAQLVLCSGRPGNYLSRPHIATRLALDDERYATVVHPTASVGSTCRVGAGTVLLAHVDLTADVVVGRHVAVMPHAVLTHDVRVGDYATLAAGVRVAGACRLGEACYIGSGACLRERIVVGDRALVGMASVVTRDVPPERLWYGAPARDVAHAPGAASGGQAPSRSIPEHALSAARSRTDEP